MTTPGKYSEPSNIIKFIIYPNGGGASKEMRQTVVALDYYESILENYIHMTLTCVDLEGSFQKLKLSGSERVEISIQDNYTQILKFKELYIRKIRNVYTHTARTIFTLDLVPKEAILNESVIVPEGYNGKLSDTIQKILSTKLKTTKNIEVDETANAPNINGDSKRPFRLCTELAKKCIPADKKNTAGYFFFETYDGYKIKSIDKLFDEKRGYRSYIYNLTTGLPKGYDGKILAYYAHKTVDVIEKMMIGAYGSKLQTYDAYSDIFDASKSLTNDSVLAAYTSPALNTDFTPESRVFYKKLDVGVMPNGATGKEQLKGQTQENIKTSNIIMQASARYNQIFTLRMEISIPGDNSHRAGDLIYCDFPSQTAGENSPEIDKEISGIYMISDVCYHVTPTITYTKMNLIRDSYGRKPKA